MVTAWSGDADTDCMNETTSAASAARSTTDPARPAHPAFYWELAPDEQQVLRGERRGLAEEGYLAIDINHGRRLASIPCAWEDWPDVAPSADSEIERYSDAIACLLHAAATDGHLPDDVIGRAFRTAESTYQTSHQAARQRNHHA